MARIMLKVDGDVKRDAKVACEKLGLSVSTAVTMYLKKLGREKRIPFDVSVDPFYSDENIARLKESVSQMEATGGTVHEVVLDD